MDNVIVKKSKIGQFDRGVFANKDFKKGETIIKYNLRLLTKKEFQNLSESDKQFTHEHFGKRYLYPLPERYVNHSSNPNTFQNLRQRQDVALRDIKKGEEITTDSTKDDLK